MHSPVSGVNSSVSLWLRVLKCTGEFVFVPRIGIAAWLGGWVMGTDHGQPCESAEPS